MAIQTIRQQQQEQRRGLAAAAAAHGRGGRAGRNTERYTGILSQSQQHQPPEQQQQQHARRQPPHVQQQAGAPFEVTMLGSRQWLQRQLPLQQFRAVGVSFEGRQELIPLLQRDQGVALVREPENPHDPHAVAIRTLDGGSLGYIARDKTFHFLQDLCLGWVGSVGQQGEDGLWGFNVLVQPTMPPVEVQALPASLLPHISPRLALTGPAWESAKQETLAASSFRCELTGAPVAAAREHWAVDDSQRVLRLLGLRAEAPEVQQVGALLVMEAQGQVQAAEQATEMLRELNCWSVDDVAAYLAHMRQLQQQRSSSSGWRLDLSWLQQRGIELPPALQALCAG